MFWRVLLFAAVMVLQPKFILAEPPATRCPSGTPAEPAKELSDRLADEFKEFGVVTGVNTAGQLMIIYAKDDDSTWTVVVIEPNTRTACIMAYGTNLQIVRQVGDPT